MGVWGWAFAAWAGPVSPGAHLAEPTVFDVDLKLVGGSPVGWIAVSESESTPFGGVLVAQRVGADGVVADATPIDLFPWIGYGTALWDGVEYVVVAGTSEEYYDR